MLLLLLFFPLIVWSQLPQEYELLLRYRQTGDPSIGYRILREYPQAVFRDDLLLMLSKEESKRKRKDRARKLLEEINPSRLRESLREDYLNLWKELKLDPKQGFLKSPVLFREFIPQLELTTEEALRASEELFRRRFYKEVISLLERSDPSKACYLLGRSYQALRDRDRALQVFENCRDPRAKVELALLYFELGDKSRVEQVLQAMEDRELLSETLFRLGRRTMHAGNYGESLAYLSRMEPSYKREFNLGLVLYALGEYKKATEHFLRSVNYARGPEERSASYFWAYKSQAGSGERETEYLLKASNGAGFYHAVASSVVGVPVASRAMKAVIEDEAIPKTASIVRAIWLAGFPEYARAEAFRRIEEMSSSDVLSLSRLDPYLAVRLAVRKYGYGSFVYSAVAFPRPYRELVEKASQRYQIEPALIYAVMRQESLFDPYAVSVANARGLMQLIDSTAREVAKKEGIRLRNIYDPETNILLGSAYLRHLLDQWGGDVVRTLASYNAGPGRVRGWPKVEDHYLFIETIPITETRDYVKKVLYNYYVYSELLK